MPVENGSAYTLEKNENWHGGFLGTIRHIELVGITRADAAESSFRTGDVSVMRSSRIAADDETTVIGGAVDTLQTPSTALHYIGINYANEQLKDAKVRRALSAAIGRRALCETQLQTFADPAVLPVNPQQQVSGVTLSTEADTSGAYELLHSETDDKKADDTASQDSAAQTAADGDVTIYYAEDGTPLTDDEGYYTDEDGDRVLNAEGEPVKDPVLRRRERRGHARDRRGRGADRAVAASARQRGQRLQGCRRRAARRLVERRRGRERHGGRGRLRNLHRAHQRRLVRPVLRRNAPYAGL